LVYVAMPSSLAAVPPRIAILSSSLSIRGPSVRPPPAVMDVLCLTLYQALGYLRRESARGTDRPGVNDLAHLFSFLGEAGSAQPEVQRLFA
jgi:hypothetical protein